MKSRSFQYVLLVACGGLFTLPSLVAQQLGPADRSAQTSAPLSSASSTGELALVPSAPVPQRPGRLTFQQRFQVEARESFEVPALLYPAAEAGIDMAHPPAHYPHDWSDGPGAYGRLYGAELARHTAGGFGRFLTQAVDQEDPRYYRSTHAGFFPRGFHAGLFTIFDRSAGGHTTFALGNVTGALSAGFVGMSYQPSGFNDVAHALQRSEWEFGSYGLHNVLVEFSPEIYRTMRHAHVPDRLARIFLYHDPPTAD